MELTIEVRQVLEAAVERDVRHLVIRLREARAGAAYAEFIDVLRQGLAGACLEEAAERARTQAGTRGHGIPRDILGEMLVDVLKDATHAPLVIRAQFRAET